MGVESQILYVFFVLQGAMHKYLILAAVAMFVLILVYIRICKKPLLVQYPQLSHLHDPGSLDSFRHWQNTSKVNQTHHEKPFKCKKTYFLSLSFYDQVTSASARLTTLQCWAGLFKETGVVQPFLQTSFLGIPPPGEAISSSTRFSDLFNVSHWNEYLHKQSHSFAPLVSWEEFIDCAPRKTLLVEVIHQSLRPSYSCTFSQTEDYFSTILQPLGFGNYTLVCVDLRKYSRLTTEDEFYHEVFGDENPNVTVIFEEWRGIQNVIEPKYGDRSITLNSSCTCPNSRELVSHGLVPSSKVLYDAERYAKQYISGSSYITVMMRVEHIATKFRQSGAPTPSRLTSIINSSLEDFWSQHKLNGAFLTTDMGGFGSKVYNYNSHKNKFYQDNSFMTQVFRLLYGYTMSFEYYEQTFRTISSSTNSGYISVLQKAIAARSTCLILAGGGSYQVQAFYWYQNLHHGDAKCVSALNRYGGKLELELIT